MNQRHTRWAAGTLVAAMLASAGCAIRHEHHIRTDEPIHIQLDVNVRIDRQLEEFFDFEERVERRLEDGAGPDRPAPPAQ